MRPRTVSLSCLESSAKNQDPLFPSVMLYSPFFQFSKQKVFNWLLSSVLNKRETLSDLKLKLKAFKIVEKKRSFQGNLETNIENKQNRSHKETR